ncbi:hypothetical protein OSH11_11760 [Kaistia dalseonensis]|uniref:DUF5666 domain-containing protein n=1 Tax=Kaistia dalseonensis TaxID=410840 RepID=A0ABU0H6N5_9HYPH|nr:hypothetical protein [Kaistia dalseonensis]MCX5495385.1 hypothetical protein [Kaistia dalseonensis]MDQ0437973.1 hypothetical protein [Kaistia dalseonensis]
MSASQVVGTVTGGAGKNSVRVTVDAAAFVAKGSTPDASATTATSATDAKRYLAAGTSIDLILYAGQKIAVLAAS